jgi:hypothetical protein
MDAEPANALPRQQIRDLTAINREDMIGAWGLDQWPARRLIARLCWPPAYLFAREVAAYDRHVDRHGLAAGAGWILRRHVGRVEVANEAAVPTEGPDGWP